MLDKIQLPQFSKATLVSIICENFPGHTTREETDASLDELRELLRTLEIEAGEQYIQVRKKSEAATILGKGKLLELAELAKNEKSHFLVFDFELTATQVRNIKKITDLDVIDRCNVILEIFAKHARTREAKIQIEISRLQYLLPRLSIMWTHFSRQKGGVGVRGGEGEQQIELDRRIIRERIEFYKKQIKGLAVSREEQRKKRKDKVVMAALVGYTNAGKSSVLNRLCKVNILEENKLFATMDATYRTLNPDSKPPMVLIDTVGFISNLPATLISGFKTTLESAMEADLLIIVCDVSDPNAVKHLEVTHQVLEELKVDHKERLYVFNKKDLLPNEMSGRILLRSYPNSFLVSSYDPMDMMNLRNHIMNFFLDKQEHYDLFIPYQFGHLHSLILAKTNIINSVNHEEGIFYRIRVPHSLFHTLGVSQYILAPNDPKIQALLPS